MLDKKNFKNLLVTGRLQSDDEETDEVETVIEEELEIEEPLEEVQAVDLDPIETELAEIKTMLQEMGQPQQQDLVPYMTTKDQTKKLNASIERIESSNSNKRLVGAMEQMSIMREDFNKLCSDIRDRLDKMDAETVLSSFEAYKVDMENILTDAGVFIGHFEFDRLNTTHHRIIGVIPTDDESIDGTIAERHTDGYRMGDRVLLKEKVSVYKLDPSGSKTTSEKPETPKDSTEETE